MHFDASRLTATGSLHKDSFDSTRLTAWLAYACPQHASGKHMATRKHNAPSREGTSVSCWGERNTGAAAAASQQTTQVTDAVMA